MKNKKDNILKRWYKLCEPNKKFWFGQIFTYTIYTICLFLITIFAARTINSIYHQNWKMAFLNLGLELATIVVRNVSLHVEYLFYGKQHIAIRKTMSRKIYKKILAVDDKKEKSFSREKIINICNNNIANAAEFPDAVAGFLAYSIQVVVTLITVYISNWVAGIIITVLGVVNFFAFYNFNKKLGKIMLRRHEKKDEMYKSYGKVMEGKLVINEYESSEHYEKELLNNTENFAKEYARYYKVTSYKTNLYYALWNVVVYAVAALMLYFVANATMDVALYLIIVPYLTSCTEKLNTLFDKTNALENMRVDVDRVNLILNLDEKQLVKYGELNKISEGYNLGLIGVSHAGEEDSGCLKDADISFKMNNINVIKGERGSGKRVIFNLLRRKWIPQEGKVLLDNLDLYDYNPKTFKNHIDYCASHPVFIKGSIKENLLIVHNDFAKAVEFCKQLQVHKTIEKYEKGYDTNIDEIKSSGVLFLLGLVRALLSECKILMIYELPVDVPQTFRNKVANFLKKNKVDKTVIVFTHSDDFDDISSLLYVVEKGKVELVKVKNKKH